MPLMVGWLPKEMGAKSAKLISLVKCVASYRLRIFTLQDLGM